jgi:hypothetical protein
MEILYCFEKEYVMSWKMLEGEVGKKVCKIGWKRDRKVKGDLWVKMELDGFVFEGKVKFVGKKGE